MHFSNRKTEITGLKFKNFRACGARSAFPCSYYWVNDAELNNFPLENRYQRLHFQKFSRLRRQFDELCIVLPIGRTIGSTQKAARARGGLEKSP